MVAIVNVCYVHYNYRVLLLYTLQDMLLLSGFHGSGKGSQHDAL